MKKIMLTLLAFSFLSISGIANAADKVFALVPKAMNNPFFDLARDGCKQAAQEIGGIECLYIGCLLYTSPSPRDLSTSRMPSSA